MIARARRSRSCQSGSATEIWCRTCSCFIGLLHLLILLEEPANGETGLSLSVPLQLLHLCLDHQVYRFTGCDCHIERFHYTLKQGCTVERLQFEEAHTLKNALALYSIVAWRL